MEVPLWAEVTAGQYLSPKGEVLCEKFLEILRSGSFSDPSVFGASQGLTGPQLAAEAKIRHHWSMYVPGADEEEWAGVRRAVLDHAFSAEKDWWVDDQVLDTTQLEIHSLAPTVRYSHDVLHCLSASGTSARLQGSGSSSLAAESLFGNAKPIARATYCGDGTLGDLELDAKAITDRNLTFDEIFAAAKAAADDAHLRLCTLSAAKVSEFRRLTQQYALLASTGTEFGGKFGRTYCDAFERAAAEVLLPAQALEDKLREAPEPDRFASSTHPELRKRLWSPRVNAAQQNLDDPTPEMKSTWGNEL
jgi:hypothetical protein